MRLQPFELSALVVQHVDTILLGVHSSRHSSFSAVSVRCPFQLLTQQAALKWCCAGAGLYDSIPFPALEEQPIDYATDQLLWDSAFRQQILQGLVDLGKSVEDAFDGVPQDIEGVYSDGKFTVVQSRPQVL